MKPGSKCGAGRAVPVDLPPRFENQAHDACADANDTASNRPAHFRTRLDIPLALPRFAPRRDPSTSGCGLNCPVEAQRTILDNNGKIRHMAPTVAGAKSVGFRDVQEMLATLAYLHYLKRPVMNNVIILNPIPHR